MHSESSNFWLPPISVLKLQKQLCRSSNYFRGAQTVQKQPREPHKSDVAVPQWKTEAPGITIYQEKTLRTLSSSLPTQAALFSDLSQPGQETRAGQGGGELAERE